MTSKNFLIILISSFVLLATVITLYIVLPKQEDVKIEKRSDEYLHYAEYFNFELSEDNSYYSITGLKNSHQKDDLITLPNTIDNIPVKKWIGDQQNFSSWRQIKQVFIPENIEYIGTDTNDDGINNGGTYGKNIMIVPSSELNKFIVSENNKVYCDIDGVLFSKDQKVLLRFPNAKSADSDNLRYEIPDTVQYVYSRAFYYNSIITRIKLGENVEEIMDEAFYSCSHIRSIEMNTKLKTIGSLCFKLSSLISIDFPEGFIKVGVNSFGICEELESVFLPISTEIVGLDAFRKCDKLIIYTPESNVDRLKAMDNLRGITILPA